MPYVPPRSFDRTLRRDRPWVFAGGAVLAAVAGFVNVCLLSFFTVPVSHMTGAVSRLSIDFESGNIVDLHLVLAIVGGFLLGAVVSGVLIGSERLMPGRRYGVALVFEGVLLSAATFLLMQANATGVVLAAMACGVQNAMASSYYGLVVRTTHVTGIVTDIGVMIGHWLRHRRVHAWKLALLTSLLVSFFGGGFVAALALDRFRMGALAIPSVGCLVAGVTYYVWRHHQRTPQRQVRVGSEP